MNEKLNELVSQARLAVHQDNLPFEQGLHRYSEQLALDVILECANWISENLEPLSDEQQVQLIKHFGIK